VLAFNAAFSILRACCSVSFLPAGVPARNMQKYYATGPGSGGWGAAGMPWDQRTGLLMVGQMRSRLYWLVGGASLAEHAATARRGCGLSDVNLLTMQIPLAPGDTPQVEEAGLLEASSNA